ncbi:hypothetical protein BDV95DRAFT_605898 [Massariosphaeria phaeospora]|uniref:Uncharacterized protein n=1 Tax=Massariosphaeria phaeospora TaxID=100035 RepID=A0A7C8I712_9PLEO|nr:hypothetical protein BDV95DRAFT_605898 [Massariosphaeria phaeospora]
MLSTISRPAVRRLHTPFMRRSFYSKSAEFIVRTPENRLVTQKVDITLSAADDPYQSSFMLPVDAGHAFRASCAAQGLSLSSDSEILPLIFYHDTRHFAHAMAPYPRFVIQHDLPRPSNANTSPATLYLFGKTHSVALNVTPDDRFTQFAHESWHEMRHVLKKLEDM